MKISTALVLILLTGLTVWAWQQRTTVSRDAITEEQEMVAPEVIRSEEPIPPVEPPTPVEPQKPVEPIPPVEPPTPVEPPEISLSPVDRVRECLRRQAAIVVPHALASVVEVSDERYAEATVTRLEPDEYMFGIPRDWKKSITKQCLLIGEGITRLRPRWQITIGL